MDDLGGWIFFGCVVVLAIYGFAGSEFSRIAEMKGHNGKKYFWWCFLTGAIGWAMVIALPERKAEDSDTVHNDILASESNALKTADDLPEL